MKAIIFSIYFFIDFNFINTYIKFRAKSKVTPGIPATAEIPKDKRLIGTVTDVNELAKFTAIKAIIPEKEFFIVLRKGCFIFNITWLKYNKRKIPTNIIMCK